MARISRSSERITEYGLYHKGIFFPFSISSLTNGVSQMLPTSLHIFLKLHDLIAKSLDLVQNLIVLVPVLALHFIL